MDPTVDFRETVKLDAEFESFEYHISFEVQWGCYGPHSYIATPMWIE